ncbi:MAG: low molecular weight protein-tyrosine-phosphatase [Kiritimatiellia bacterium]
MKPETRDISPRRRRGGGNMKILFLCHGNICRSPMAEFVMKELLRRAGRTDVDVQSAALHPDAIGCDTHRRTREKLREKAIPFTPRQAWLLTPAKAHEYDLLIGMDDANRDDLRRLVRDEDQAKVRTLLSFAGSDRPIADPWYTHDFDATYRDVLAGCTALLNRLAEP